MSSTYLDKTFAGPILAEQVCFALYSTSGVVTQAYAKLLTPHGLTYPQFVVLMGLWQKNGASVTELAAIVSLSKGTLTPILKKLETLGFIERKRIEGNERTMALLMTAKAHSFADEARLITEKALCATGLSNDEASHLISLCSKVKSKLSGRD